MVNMIPIQCTACKNTFKVRISDQATPGRKYRISCCCPNCGQQISEIKTIPGKKGSRSLTYMVGIPVAVLLVVFLASAIAGRMGYTSPAFQDINGVWKRLEQYAGSRNMMLLISKVIVLLICFPVHECAHAWMADRLGDPTGRLQGRITLNPFEHLDPWGTITIFLFGVGYAKPVPVRIQNFKNRKRDYALTALAGPLSNFLMAVIFILLMRILPWWTMRFETYEMLWEALGRIAFINVSLAVFNLIPIPPLDGSRIIGALLPDGADHAMQKYERYMMITLLIAIFGLSRAGYSPISSVSGKIFHVLYRAIMQL